MLRHQSIAIVRQRFARRHHIPVQSGSAAEHTVYDVPAGCSAGCDYYVVVRGFDGSTSPYNVTIRVE